MKQKHTSKIMEAIHEEAQALFEVGAIDKERMAEYDDACLVSNSKKKTSVKNPASSGRRQPATPAYAHSH